MRRHLIRVALPVLASTLLLGWIPGASGQVDEGTSEYEVLFSVPIGDSGIEYAVLSEEATHGPTALAVGGDGTIWIADSVGKRILQYSLDGKPIDIIDLSAQVAGIADIAVQGSQIAILDVAPVPAKVFVAEAGADAGIASITVPEEFGLYEGLSGVSLSATGEILIEMEGGARVAVFTKDGVLEGVIPGYPVGDQVFSVERVAADGPSSVAEVRLGQVTFEVKVSNTLGGVYFLGLDGDSLVILVEEVSQRTDGTIYVDQTVRRYDASGAPAGIGRVPVGERFTYVPSGIGAGPGGDLVALVPRPDRVDVVRVNLREEIQGILPPAPAFAPPDTALPAACRSRTDMALVGSGYLANSKYLNNTNINGSCSERTKPRYLGSAGTYRTVPYDWNGWDLRGTFNSKMDNGLQAGDINSPSATCSRGTDCSGYVSRIWGLSTHVYTCGIVNISYVVAVNNMLGGDVFNTCDSHVAEYDAASGGGYYITDSTTENAIDRVSHRWVTASWINNYTPRRYNNVCS
jgi:hypothetical protein